ncbi:MAG: asparaginase [Bacteroidetes bacterium]|nr:MAG: asparaginase [Bacteroidota bacterium]
MKIKIFVTGGTFDKEYNELNGELFFKDTHLTEILSLGRSRVPVDIRTLMMIDSLKMTDADRNNISENCLQATEDKIIITHGTDTMVETAQVIAQTPALKGVNQLPLGRGVNGGQKTIVLTGALIPYKFGSSDGLFNLGSALAFVQTLSPGVYIAMNGRYFNWDNVRKNRELGEFVPLR